MLRHVGLCLLRSLEYRLCACFASAASPAGVCELARELHACGPPGVRAAVRERNVIQN